MKITAEAKYFVNFTRPGRTFVLSIIVEVTISYLLMWQKCINSKQNIHNKNEWNNTHVFISRR